MKVVLLGRDQHFLAPLAARLQEAGFTVLVVENSSGVQSCLKRGGFQFLVAETSFLIEHSLGREVLKRCPLARLVALVAQPGLLDMANALAHGLIDYFPRSPEHFDELVEMLAGERRRLLRWQRAFLSDSGWAGRAGGAPSPTEPSA